MSLRKLNHAPRKARCLSTTIAREENACDGWSRRQWSTATRRLPRVKILAIQNPCSRKVSILTNWSSISPKNIAKWLKIKNNILISSPLKWWSSQRRFNFLQGGSKNAKNNLWIIKSEQSQGISKYKPQILKWTLHDTGSLSAYAWCKKKRGLKWRP